MADDDTTGRDVAVVGGALLLLWLLLHGGSAGAGSAAGNAGQLGAAALRPRCLVRIDVDGVSVNGQPATVADVAARCLAAGATSADVLVTGSARQGTYEAVLAELARAGIATHLRAP